MAVIAFPKILTDRLTDEGARALTDILNTVEHSTQETTLQIAEERFEKRLAQVEIKIEQSKAETIKWMFIFWVGQVTTIVGILFAFFKH